MQRDFATVELSLLRLPILGLLFIIFPKLGIVCITLLKYNQQQLCCCVWTRTLVVVSKPKTLLCHLGMFDSNLSLDMRRDENFVSYLCLFALTGM